MYYCNFHFVCVVKIESTYKFNALQILSCLSGSRIDQKTECTNWQPVSIPTSGIIYADVI